MKLGAYNNYIYIYIYIYTYIFKVGGKHLQEGIEENDVLVSLDLRLTQINAENEYTINQKIRDNADS